MIHNINVDIQVSYLVSQATDEINIPMFRLAWVKLCRQAYWLCYQASLLALCYQASLLALCYQASLLALCYQASLLALCYQASLLALCYQGGALQFFQEIELLPGPISYLATPVFSSLISVRSYFIKSTHQTL